MAAKKKSDSAHQEVEIKFVVQDLELLARRLRTAGFRIKSPRAHEMNTLYDSSDRSISGHGEVLRIRKYGKIWTLTHKSPSQDGVHKVRIETESRVDDGAKLGKIFAAMGLMPAFRYEKFRTEWTDGKGDVVIDETPIGNVAEIEGSPTWIDRTARNLGVRPEDYSTASYVKMFFDWKRATGSNAVDMTWRAITGKSRPK